jgi:hypothetical protein
VVGCLSGHIHTAYRTGGIQDLGYELRRIYIPRTSVNKGKIQGPGSRCSYPALPLPLASADAVDAARTGAARSGVVAGAGSATSSVHASTNTATIVKALSVGGADRARGPASHAESVGAGALETADAATALSVGGAGGAEVR